VGQEVIQIPAVILVDGECRGVVQTEDADDEGQRLAQTRRDQTAFAADEARPLPRFGRRLAPAAAGKSGIVAATVASVSAGSMP
jgi:hypothetical protein